MDRARSPYQYYEYCMQSKGTRRTRHSKRAPKDTLETGEGASGHQLRCLQLCRLLSGFPLFQRGNPSSL